ncbi:MAG TPA: zinc ribbon domain-containing protein, partial [Armatimonadota bacterium]|nr:zinc ribbon domain-containing protein [Armatimonadota bacterium]
MNCPYCDETVHAMAKFCPKCGLPLKDDATIMGGPVVDQPGPNRWFIVAGVGGVVALALSLGFMSARGSSRPTQTTRREPVGRYFAPSSTTMGGAYAQPRSLTPIPRGAAPMAPSPRPSLGYGGGTRWAYTPRAPQPRSFVPQAPQAPPPDPAPPQVPLAQIDA